MEQQIKQFLNDLDQAMVELDTNKLDYLLANDAILQHITGYLQPKEEWLSAVAVDYFNYRQVSSENISVQQVDDLYVVTYDWTIIGNSRWPFRNRLTLKEVNGQLQWTGQNNLNYR